MSHHDHGPMNSFLDIKHFAEQMFTNKSYGVKGQPEPREIKEELLLTMEPIGAV